MDQSHATPSRTVIFQALAAMLALVACIVFFSSDALGLEVEKFTARPNQATGSVVVGGEKTRLTWEASVQSDEISSLQLKLPAQTESSDAQAKITVLEGLNRLDVESQAEVQGESLTITFLEALPTQSLLRVEIEPVILDAQGGEMFIEGSYTTASGKTYELAESPHIQVQELSRVQAIVSYLDNQAWVQAWNSNTFLNMFFKPQLIVTSAVDLFFGWLKALSLVALGFPLAIPLGLAFAFMKMSAIKIARILASLYINIIRGTPLFLQVYIAFFGLPLLGININNYIVGVVVLALNSSAYLAEIFRAGIESISRGQFEAAASLGMNQAQSMLYVIIPQTIRRVIPTMTSEFILLYKDTSLLSSVGVMELMMFSKNITATTGNITPYIIAAGYYLLVTLPLIKVVGILEDRLDDTKRGGLDEDAHDDSHSVSLSHVAHESR